MACCRAEYSTYFYLYLARHRTLITIFNRGRILTGGRYEMKPAEGSICILVKAGVQWNSMKGIKKKNRDNTI